MLPVNQIWDCIVPLVPRRSGLLREFLTRTPPGIDYISLYAEHGPDFVDVVDTLRSLSTPAEILRFLHRQARKTRAINAVSHPPSAPINLSKYRLLLACKVMRRLGSEYTG